MKQTKKSYNPIYSKTFIFLSAILLFLSSCLPKETEGPELQSAINVVNAATGTGALGFFIGKQKVEGEPLKYTEESGYFITIPGIRDFDVIAEGSTNYTLRTNFDLKQDTYHTMFIAGETGTVTSLFTEDDLTTPPSGKAKIRFVQLSSDAGDLVLSAKNSVALSITQSYKTASAFALLDPGVYDLQLKTATGTLLTELNVTITPGKIYTVWSKGLLSGKYNSPVGLQFRSIN